MAIQALESEIGATRRMGGRRRRKDDEAPAVPAPSPRPHADTFWQPAPPSPAANVERVQRKYRAKRKAAPLAAWVRSASPAAAQRKDGKPATPATPADDLRMFLASLNVPQHVAGVMYASGCRIRRVNIVQRPRPRGKKGDPVLILSHKALRQVRKEEAPTAIALARCSAS
jgi:hypothetical protein